MPAPFELGQPRCGAYTFTGAGGSPQPCRGRPTLCGLVLTRRPPIAVWRAFVCEGHRELVDAPRELLDRDRAVMEAWREQTALALEGKRYQRPAPMATGAAARELHRRAVARSMIRP